MEYKVTLNNDSTAEVDITYSVADLDSAFDKAFIRASKKVKINGFRQGKAPVEMVKKILGESAVTEDAISGLLSESIDGLNDKLEFRPFRYPKVSIVKFERNNELNAKASYETAPEVKLGEYKNLELKKYSIKVSDQEIADELLQIQKQLSKTASKEEGEVAQEKDLLELDIDTYEGETKINSAPNQFYEIGVSEKQKRIDSELLGLKVGEEKTFDFTYDEDAGPSLSGKVYTFKVKVNSLSKIILPELDDNLAKEFDDSESLEALKNKIKEQISGMFAERLNQYYFSILLTLVNQGSKFSFPASLIEDERNAIIERIKLDTKMTDLTLEKYSEILKQSLDETKSNLDKQATRNIQNFLSIQKIYDLEKLQITPQEISATYDEVTKNMKTKPKPEFQRNIIQNIISNLTQKKVEEFLVSGAKVVSNEEISIAKANEILNSPLEVN